METQENSWNWPKLPKLPRLPSLGINPIDRQLSLSMWNPLCPFSFVSLLLIIDYFTPFTLKVHSQSCGSNHFHFSPQPTRSKRTTLKKLSSQLDPRVSQISKVFANQQILFVPLHELALPKLHSSTSISPQVGTWCVFLCTFLCMALLNYFVSAILFWFCFKNNSWFNCPSPPQLHRPLCLSPQAWESEYTVWMQWEIHNWKAFLAGWPHHVVHWDIRSQDRLPFWNCHSEDVHVGGEQEPELLAG